MMHAAVGVINDVPYYMHVLQWPRGVTMYVLRTTRLSRYVRTCGPHVGARLCIYTAASREPKEGLLKRSSTTWMWTSTVHHIGVSSGNKPHYSSHHRLQSGRQSGLFSSCNQYRTSSSTHSEEGNYLGRKYCASLLA